MVNFLYFFLLFPQFFFNFCLVFFFCEALSFSGLLASLLKKERFKKTWPGDIEQHALRTFGFVAAKRKKKLDEGKKKRGRH